MRRREFRASGVEGRRGSVFEAELDGLSRGVSGYFGGDSKGEVDSSRHAAAGDNVFVADDPASSGMAPKSGKRCRHAQ